MFGFLSIFLITSLILLAVLALFAGGLLTGVLFSAWLLTLVSPLSFAEASVLTAITALLFIQYEQEQIDIQPTNLVLLIVLATPPIDLLILALAWLVDLATSLDFHQATLLTGTIGLAALYNLLVRLSSFSDRLLEMIDDDEEDDNEDEEEEYEYEEEDEAHDLIEWLYSKSPKKKR